MISWFPNQAIVHVNGTNYAGSHRHSPFVVLCVVFFYNTIAGVVHMNFLDIKIQLSEIYLPYQSQGQGPGAFGENMGESFQDYS